MSDKTTTLSLIFHAELTPDQVTMLSITLQDIVGEVAKWTVGAVPFEIVQVGGAPAVQADAITFDSGDEGVSIGLGGIK